MLWWIVKMFNPQAHWGSVIFSFGDTIYTHKYPLSKTELAHEKVHLQQHHYSKLFAIYDAVRSFIDKKYYLQCEIEAYQAENKIERNPQLYAWCLSSPVYNNLISYEDALKLFL